jgi:hypothetical protein
VFHGHLGYGESTCLDDRSNNEEGRAYIDGQLSVVLVCQHTCQNTSKKAPPEVIVVISSFNVLIVIEYLAQFAS